MERLLNRTIWTAAGVTLGKVIRVSITIVIGFGTYEWINELIGMMDDGRWTMNR